MNETTGPPDDFEELAGLVRASFPDIRCLRCGYDQFYSGLNRYTLARRELGITGLVSYIGDDHEILTLACTRCGHLEHHMLKVLEGAKKPIPAAAEQ
jgi:predicted nucleic-acid-binding Zn-ribbon protein